MVLGNDDSFGGGPSYLFTVCELWLSVGLPSQDASEHENDI
jgi:hypothetical protein